MAEIDNVIDMFDALKVDRYGYIKKLKSDLYTMIGYYICTPTEKEPISILNRYAKIYNMKDYNSDWRLTEKTLKVIYQICLTLARRINEENDKIIYEHLKLRNDMKDYFEYAFNVKVSDKFIEMTCDEEE